MFLQIDEISNNDKFYENLMKNTATKFSIKFPEFFFAIYWYIFSKILVIFIQINMQYEGSQLHLSVQIIFQNLRIFCRKVSIILFEVQHSFSKFIMALD